jgi:predicted Rossmann fold nucleotide-binding protein DprA/Smf involved in DNA uptake
MGGRGNWNSDVLVERSGLPFPELQHALLLLELEGRVRRRGCEFDPV